MQARETKTAIDMAARELRKIVLAREPGALIGREDALTAMLGCSRSTVRQVARLLEREGLLRVRRGINGGYFGARPDAGTIEAAVSSYLETLDIDSRDVTVVASALWVEVMRKAASANRDQAQKLADRLVAKVKAVKNDAPFDKISRAGTAHPVRDIQPRQCGLCQADLRHQCRIYKSPHEPPRCGRCERGAPRLCLCLEGRQAA